MHSTINIHTEDMQWDSGKMKKPKSLTDFMRYIEKSKASSPKCQKCADDLSAERVSRYLGM